MPPEKKKKQVNIELPEDIAEGTYANMAIIAHSNSEFILDFIRMVPNVPKAKVKSRIILTPSHAKKLYKALKDNIEKYEKQSGGSIPDDGNPMPPLNFTPTAQA